MLAVVALAVAALVAGPFDPVLAQLEIGPATLVRGGDRFGCFPRCWETCLYQPGNFQRQYNILRRVVDEARALRLTNPRSKGTAFIIDSTATPANKFRYQQLLAAIVAVTMPVEFTEQSPARSCNPFFYAQYFEFGTWSNPRFQCLDHCSAAQVLLRLGHLREGPPNPPNDPHDFLTGGCLLADWNRQNPSIRCAPETASRDELAIAFVNSRNQGQFNPDSSICRRFDHRLQVTVSPGLSPNPVFVPQTNVFASTEWLLPAAKRLFRCVYRSCCRPYWGRRPEATSSVNFVANRTASAAGRQLKGDIQREPVEMSVEEILEKYAGGAELDVSDLLDEIEEEIKREEAGEEVKDQPVRA